MKVTFFTAGTVGAGHMVRGLALHHALQRAGFTGTYRMLGPPTPHAHLAGGGLFRPVTVDARALADRATALRSQLARALEEDPPDVLVVDLFWVPVAMVRPVLRCPTWLLLRWVPPAWLRGPPQAPFVAAHHARILAMEPAPVLQPFEPVPAVVLDPGKTAATRARLAQRLDRRPEDPLWVVAHAGRPDEAAAVLAEAQQRAPGPWVGWDLHHAGAPFPASPWLRAADRVHCAGGFNAYWEARRWGYVDRTTFSPQPRPLDDQAWRVALPRPPGGDAAQPNGADVLARMLMAG